MAGNAPVAALSRRGGVALLADSRAVRRPHSADCAVNEHREIITALRAGDVDAAIAVMDRHLGSVEQRALLDKGRDTDFDLGGVLARYAEAVEAQRRGRTWPACQSARCRAAK